MTYPVFEIRKLIYRFRNIDDSLAMETSHRYVSFFIHTTKEISVESKDVYVTVYILIILYVFVFLFFSVLSLVII
jgi:hypothetical protein